MYRGVSSKPWVVLDGYHFDPSYQRGIKQSGHPLLVIDDMAQLLDVLDELNGTKE